MGLLLRLPSSRETSRNLAEQKMLHYLRDLYPRLNRFGAPGGGQQREMDLRLTDTAQNMPRTTKTETMNGWCSWGKTSMYNTNSCVSLTYVDSRWDLAYLVRSLVTW
jgi:hypothetical protein